VPHFSRFSRSGRPDSRMAQAFDLAGTTSAGGAPSFAHFAKGGSGNAHPMGRAHVVSTSSRPALAKNARTGHPQSCYRRGNQNRRSGHPPVLGHYHSPGLCVSAAWRKPAFHHQFHNVGRVSFVRLLLAHVTGTLGSSFPVVLHA